MEEAYPDYAGRIRIVVRFEEGRVIVGGEVPSGHARRRIVERLRQMPGVRAVLDVLVVAAPLKCW